MKLWDIRIGLTDLGEQDVTIHYSNIDHVEEQCLPPPVKGIIIRLGMRSYKHIQSIIQEYYNLYI